MRDELALLSAVFCWWIVVCSSAAIKPDVDGFGSEIAIEGETIAITSIGAVHIFHKNSTAHWNKVKEIWNLGQSPVAVHKGNVYVGDEKSRAGVQIFRPRKGGVWKREQIFRTAEQSVLGMNLLVDSDGILIASGIKRDGYGSVYSYEINGNNFALSQELDVIPRDDYRAGASLASSGDHLVVGGNNRLFLFSKEGNKWNKSHRLETANLVTMSRSIAMDGDIVVCGFDPPVYPFGQGGYVVVYKVKDGKLHRQQTIVGYLSSFFGLSVALSGNIMAVGAPEEVYVYERKKQGGKVQFVRKQVLRVPDSHHMDLFGQHVAIDSDTILVGAYLRDGPGGGSAYVFSRNENGRWFQAQELKGEDPGATS